MAMMRVVVVTRERSLLPTGNTTSTFELRAGGRRCRIPAQRSNFAWHAMDTRALKLELLERLAALNDQAKLEEVKQVLDGTDGFELTEHQLHVVNERSEQYLRGEAKTYSWEEVQRMLEEGRQREGK